MTRITGGRQRKLARKRSQNSNTVKATANKKSKVVEESDEDYQPPTNPSSFHSEPVADKSDDECLAESEGNNATGQSGEEEEQNPPVVDGGGNGSAVSAPNVDTSWIDRELENFATSRALGRNGEQSNTNAVAAGTVPAPVVTGLAGIAEATDASESPIKKAWERLIGRYPVATEITLDWIPKELVDITAAQARNELLILGSKDPSDDVLRNHMTKIKEMRNAIVEVTKSLIFTTVVGEAQKEGVMYGTKIVSKFEDVGRWWASLTEAEARSNAQKMFRIQQLPFDDEEKWSKNLEMEIMAAGNLTYHRPPNTAKNAKGCIEKIITQIKVNQTKNLTDKAKKKESHGYYITVKAPKGMGRSRNRRRKPGEWREWMFHKAEANPSRSREGNHGLALIDRNRPHHIGDQFAQFAAAQGSGNVPLAAQDVATAPVPHAAAAAATLTVPEGGAGLGTASEIALQQALARINSLEERVKEANTENVSMRGVLAQLQSKKRQEGLQGLKTGKPTTGGGPAAIARKANPATKEKAKRSASGPTTDKGGQAKKTKGSKAAKDRVDDIAAKISFDTTTTATTVTEFTVPGNRGAENSGAESSDADSLGIASESDEEDTPKVEKVVKGWLDKDTGLCMVSVLYQENKTTPIVVPVASAVYDDDERIILHWVMTNRMNQKEWREQVEKKIEEMKEEGVGYEEWVGWEQYVRDKVEARDLKPTCLSIFDDSGGKPAARQRVKHPNNVTELRVSPLKQKRTGCTVHNFKSEDNKMYAVKGSGWALDGIVCAGVGGNECGKEFVSKEEEASSPEKAWILGKNNLAWWCNVCKHTLCNECHNLWCVTSVRGRRG